VKLTPTRGRKALDRYRHVEAADRSEEKCGARGPGSAKLCTRRRGHAGPHVAHGFLGRVVAAWDSGATSLDRREAVSTAGAPSKRARPVGLRHPAPPSPLATVGRLAKRALAAWDQIAFVTLFIIMVKFALDVLKTLH